MASLEELQREYRERYGGGERFQDIDGFPEYQIGEYGTLASIYGRVITPTINRGGVAKVNMSKDGRVYTRGLALLVALAFVDPPAGYPADVFNTPINLNGDRTDCRAENLLWRPRWHAIQFHRQFFNDYFFRKFDIPVLELKTNVVYENFHDPCTEYGLLYHDIAKSWVEEVYTFPTGHQFRLIKD